MISKPSKTTAWAQPNPKMEARGLRSQVVAVRPWGPRLFSAPPFPRSLACDVRSRGKARGLTLSRSAGTSENVTRAVDKLPRQNVRAHLLRDGGFRGLKAWRQGSRGGLKHWARVLGAAPHRPRPPGPERALPETPAGPWAGMVSQCPLCTGTPVTAPSLRGTQPHSSSPKCGLGDPCARLPRGCGNKPPPPWRPEMTAMCCRPLLGARSRRSRHQRGRAPSGRSGETLPDACSLRGPRARPTPMASPPSVFTSPFLSCPSLFCAPLIGTLVIRTPPRGQP